jgi:hypothetical protein
MEKIENREVEQIRERGNSLFSIPCVPLKKSSLPPSH